MKDYLSNNFILPLLLIFTGIPLFLFFTGTMPERTFLKEFLSVVTILAFFQMIALFFLTRSNRYGIENLKISKIVKVHKVIGYTCIPILLLHPFFLVIPRFFEAGIDPTEAFTTIITTFESRGIILGITAWSLMLTLGMLSFTRKKLPIKHKTWRAVHGTLAILFLTAAAFHVVNLGRHADLLMTTFIIILVSAGILLLLKTYSSSISKKEETNDKN